MRYIVAALIAIGLVILFIILLFRAIFGGGGENSPAERRVNLADYENTGVIMRMVNEGPINADELHRQVYIEVGRDGNKIQLVHGYQGNVVRQEQVNSNSSAYGSFLRAIDLLGYNNGNRSKNEAVTDYRGHCPFGNRYIFQIMDGNDVKQQFWSTSCGNEGSFRGQADQIVQLFQAQIPGYDDLTQDLGIN
jgi:hypothetical protein